ncbi:DegT/DnrJ/EryC1/StrS family aminotransferase [Mariniflexile sp. HMF6888]|uniref:DegT/DnrJ/EryC1/StrS family aminotransferase n=1 Tax=Mariniflexile sp. HMF6888 TaxID=3373086 RepID=UPI0037951DA3
MIKFLDLKALNDRFREELKNEFNHFLDSGSYILGEQVGCFETEFANYCGTKFCIGVSSGLDALHLIFEAYKTLGILGIDDEVIVPANTYIATVLAISNAGLKPVLVEPDIETFNIDTKGVLKAITSKTKAVLGVHLYGRLYNVEALEAICKAHNLLLIEDAAQAHGAINEDGRKAGNVSHAAAFSFYPTKNLGALGDAGAVTTNNEALANIINKLRNYGRKSSYENDIKGYNCRLDELQAAFLRIKLKYLDTDNDVRREIAKLYLKKINNSDIVLPKYEGFQQHVFHLFVIRSKKRDELKKYLFENGIETLIHYPIPIYKQLAYNEFKGYYFPITEKIHAEVLSIPINPVILEREVNMVIKVLNSYK